MFQEQPEFKAGFALHTPTVQPWFTGTPPHTQDNHLPAGGPCSSASGQHDPGGWPGLSIPTSTRLATCVYLSKLDFTLTLSYPC